MLSNRWFLNVLFFLLSLDFHQFFIITWYEKKAINKRHDNAGTNKLIWFKHDFFRKIKAYITLWNTLKKVKQKDIYQKKESQTKKPGSFSTPSTSRSMMPKYTQSNTLFYILFNFPSNESPPFSHSHYLPSSQCSVSADLTAIFLARVKFQMNYENSSIKFEKINSIVYVAKIDFISLTHWTFLSRFFHIFLNRYPKINSNFSKKSDEKGHFSSSEQIFQDYDKKRQLNRSRKISMTEIS